jgi:D-glycero-alpha-D-manno-heptose-7-phosphate kinase
MDADRSTITAVAPLRVSFVGGGTDFPHVYEQHGGAVLSATIDHHVTVTMAPRDDERIRVRSLDLGRLVEYGLDEEPDYDGVMDLPKAAIRHVGIDRGIDVSIRSDAPPGSGLGGSSALVTAMVAGLAMLGGRSLGARELARMCYLIEREELGISGGWQDQYAAAFGGFNLLEFSAAGTNVVPVRADAGTVERLEACLLLCYTGHVRPNVGLIDTQIRLYREGREDTLLGLKQLRESAYAMRDAIERGELDGLGTMLREAFESKRRMNPYIAEHTSIEAMLELAAREGASGGKICGAGGGGFLLLCCRPERQGAVRRALAGLGARFVPFRFQPTGVRARRGSEVWAPAKEG